MDSHVGVEQLQHLLEAVVQIVADLDLESVLHRVVETAVQLVDATYGALGVLNSTGTRLERFITVGIDDEQQRKIGSLPEGHGILGLLVIEPRPLRLPNLNEHPESFGFPPNHPPMTSFLGVPIFIRGEVYGNLYLTDKLGGDSFTGADEELAMVLASAAAVAIDSARLHDRVRQIDLIEERERIARELHDTVIQRLFATGLSLQGAVRLIERPEAAERIQQAVDDLDATVREIRTAIFELQIHQGPTYSLRRDLLAVGSDLADALGFEPSFQFEGAVDTLVPPELAVHVIAVVREGLVNVARHAEAQRAKVFVDVAGGQLAVSVTDSGRGPQPSRAAGRGLDNVTNRAEQFGGTATLEELPEGGTRLEWVIPLPE